MITFRIQTPTPDTIEETYLEIGRYSDAPLFITTNRSYYLYLEDEIWWISAKVGSKNRAAMSIGDFSLEVPPLTGWEGLSGHKTPTLVDYEGTLGIQVPDSPPPVVWVVEGDSVSTVSPPAAPFVSYYALEVQTRLGQQLPSDWIRIRDNIAPSSAIALEGLLQGASYAGRWVAIGEII